MYSSFLKHQNMNGDTVFPCMEYMVGQFRDVLCVYVSLKRLLEDLSEESNHSSTATSGLHVNNTTVRHDRSGTATSMQTYIAESCFRW